MNDAIFHIVLQENLFALKGLIASLLEVKPDTIRDIKVENPILQGDTISEKMTVLDILLTFNDGEKLDLEMQVRDQHDYTDRSIVYLCREHIKRLSHGDSYNDTKKTYHIGFLGYDLFPNHREFYARHGIMNIKDGHVYSDKINLYVVSLNRINIATEEDRKHGIDRWARFFTSTTWEDMKQIAKGDEYMEATAQGVYDSNQEDWVKSLISELAWDKKQFDEMAMRKMNKELQDLEAQKKDLQTKNEDLQTKNEDLQTKNEDLQTKNENLQTKNEDLQTKNEDLQAEIVRLRALLAEKDG